MRLTSTDASGTTTYTLRPARPPAHQGQPPAGTLTYTYDAAGNVATIRSSNTNGTSVDYTWDAANQLVSVTDNRVGGDDHRDLHAHAPPVDPGATQRHRR